MNEKLLKDLLIAAKAIDEATPAALPPSAEARFAEILGNYAPARLTEAQLRIVLLKILSKGALVVPKIFDHLLQLKVVPAQRTMAPIFDQLHAMEREGLVSKRLHPEKNFFEFQLEGKGAEVLERESDTVRNASGLLHLLWAS